VCAPDGTILGTAFVVDHGLLLTCDHVVDGVDRVLLDTDNNTVLKGRIRSGGRFPEVDLALIEVRGKTSPPLPLSAHLPTALDWWTYGFRRSENTPRSGLPAHGSVTANRAVAYTAGRRDYALKNAIILQEGTFEEGFSGAPVVDPAWGVVVGVVAASFSGRPNVGGFAVPLSAMTGIPALEALLKRNDASICRYGPYLNGLAAAITCSQQVRRAVGLLESADIVLADNWVPRHTLAREIEGFLRASEPIVVLVGDAGVGKTQEMAHLAEVESLRGRCLFVSGSQLRAGVAMEEVITNLLGAPEPARMPRDELRRIAQQLSADGRPLVVLLDALNEGDKSLGDGIDMWFAGLLQFIEEADAKVVITCRPEYWHSIRHDLANRFLYGGRNGIQCNDFDETEAALGLEAYALASTGLRPEDVRHPLLLRLYREQVNAGHEVRRLSRMEALSEFTETKVQAAARRSGSPASFVRPPLVRLAAAVVRTGERWMDEGRVAEFFATQPSVLGKLMDEGMFRRANDLIGFAFDEVAEFLAAGSLDPTQQLEFDGLKRLGASSATPQYAGALLFSILRLESTDPGSIGPVIERLSSASRDPTGWTAGWVLRRLFTELRSVSAFVAAFENHLEAVGRFDARWWVSHVAAGTLGTADTFRLLRVLARHEWQSAWEPKHWDELEFEDGDGSESVGDAADTRLRQDERSALKALATWLDDTTPLEIGGGLMVRTVAQGLLFHHARGRPRPVIGFLLGLRKDPSWLIGRLLDHEPGTLLGAARAWSGSRRLREVRGAALIARQAVFTWDVGGEHRDTAIDILLTLCHHPDAEARRLTLEPLLMTRRAPRGITQEAIQLFERGDPWMPASFLGSGLGHHFCAVLTAFERRLQVGDDSLVDVAMLTAVVNCIGPRLGHRRARRILDFLRAGAKRGENTRIVVAKGIESLLGHLDPDGVIAHDACDLAIRMMREGPWQVRTPLVWLATSPYRRVTSTTREQLLQALASAPDPDTVRHAITSLARLGPDYPDAWSWIARLAPAISADELDFDVLSCAEIDEPHAVWLEEHFREPTTTGGSRLRQRFLEARRGGASGLAAARAAVYP
jgi:Trypsin-like peptidase domain